MTFAEAITSLTVTVDRDDLASKYINFLNAAVRETALRWNFPQMKTTGTVTIATSAKTVALPSDFKAWQNLRFPASVVIGSASSVQVPVYTREEIERLSPAFRPTLYLVFSQDNGAYQITLPANATASNVFTIYYFAYPATVTDTTTTTPLLRDYENLVMSKARSLVFESINDPVYVAHESQFVKDLMDLTGVSIKSAFIKSTKPRADPDGEQPS
jgi:hypothetical protein